MLLCSCFGVLDMLSIFAICTKRPIRKGMCHGKVRKPYVLRQTFDFLKLEASCHPCSKGGISTFGPVRPTYCQLQVKSRRVDLLHLMCRSHVQSAPPHPPPGPQLNAMLASMTKNCPKHPRCTLAQARSTRRLHEEVRGGQRSKLSQNIVGLRMGGYFAHAL